MISCWILLLVAQVSSFAPLVVRNSPYHATLFSAVEATVETDESASASTSIPNSDSLPILFPALATPLNKLGFSTPTPIQSASAKRALELENLLLIAPTGSGKTFSYMLPALEKVVTQQNQNRSTVLVVAPTRELGLQLMRDTTSILSNLGDDSNNNKLSVLLAVQGVEIPTTKELNAATVLVGTPKELLQVLSSTASGSDFLAGDVLSSVILDEVDVLLPNPPKQLRLTSIDNAGNARKEKGGGTKKGMVTPKEERRRLVQKRKLLAAKRSGVDFSMEQKIVGPTETLLKMIAGRRLSTANNGDPSTATTPYQVIAGSATASRKTLDRLNKALRDAALDASSTVDVVWNGTVQPCRPEEVMEDSNKGDNEGTGVGEEQQDHTIRTVTVPSQVKHQYVRLEKDMATKPSALLNAVAKATRTLQPKQALLFLCGEFKKQSTAAPVAERGSRTPIQQPRKGRQKTLKQKKLEATAASRAKQPSSGMSAQKACAGLAMLGIEAKPLHVALGLDANAKEGDATEDDGEVDALPPFLVTFEGAARGLHLDDVDTVFVVGRPASAASYLHLAGRVGRSSTSENGEVVIRPGNVISFCTAGSSKELNKWTKQVGGTDLEELVL